MVEQYEDKDGAICYSYVTGGVAYRLKPSGLYAYYFDNTPEEAITDEDEAREVTSIIDDWRNSHGGTTQ